MRDPWERVTALADVSRRALYDFVRRQDHPVNREDAAEATGMSRNLAAFHLDKLVDAGLLRAHYASRPGRRRGRGRTPKVYEPAEEGIALTIPERRYELIAGILADAVDDDPRNAAEAAREHARRRGHEIGSRSAADRSVPEVLEGLGFDPRPEGSRTVLRNCPFHELAGRHQALVCGLNHAFLSGVLDGMGAGELRARLAPRPGACCVELTPQE